MNSDVPPVSSEVPQAIQRRVGFERPTVIGECHKGCCIKADLQLIRESPLNSRVQAHSGALEGDLYVGTSTAKMDGAHQQWSAVVHTLVSPLDESYTELQGVDTASVLELKSVIHQSECCFMRGTPGDVVSNQVGEQGGGTGQEPRKPTRVSARNIHAVFGIILKMNQGARPSDSGNL